MPAATKSTSFLHLATIGYLFMLVQGILAVVRLDSKPRRLTFELHTFPSFGECDLVSLANAIANETISAGASKKVTKKGYFTLNRRKLQLFRCVASRSWRT